MVGARPTSPQPFALMNLPAPPKGAALGGLSSPLCGHDLPVTVHRLGRLPVRTSAGIHRIVGGADHGCEVLGKNLRALPNGTRQDSFQLFSRVL